MSLGGILLGLINVAIVVAVLVLIGYIAMMIFAAIGFPIPATIQKIFMIIVALIALYLIVQLLLGVGPPFRILGSGKPHAAIAHLYT
jgi:hypothetical protein